MKAVEELVVVFMIMFGAIIENNLLDQLVARLESAGISGEEFDRFISGLKIEEEGTIHELST
jgi:hypothetical protein